MKKIFLDLDGTLARFNVPNALKRFAIETDFFKNLLPYKNIGEIDKMALKGNVYIISASPNVKADIDKMEWVQKWLPCLPLQNIIICRVGMNKAEHIKSKLHIDINSDCILLDDYTKNLQEWETAGGVGIKRITKVANNITKKWQGLQLTDLCQLANLVDFT